MSDEKFLILEKMLQKKFKNKNVSISTGNDASQKAALSGFIDTGCMRLNLDIGGGYPRGRLIEIYGLESSAKTTLALSAVKNEQKLGNKCVYIDAEHALNSRYMTSVGVDFEKLMLIRTETAEQTWEACEMAALSGEASLIVLDSIAALVPELAWEKGIDGDTRARLASVNTKALSMIIPALAKTNTTLLLINQVRQGQDMYGPKETTPGGNLIKFFAAVRIRIKKKQYEKNSDGVPIGQTTDYQIVKNKVSSPGKEGDFKVIYGQGIDEIADLVETSLLVPTSGIELSGSWIKFDGKTICQGKDNLVLLLRDDPEFANTLKNNLMMGII